MKQPIIAFAHHPWNEPQWMNRQQLLSRLGARGWPVVYSSGALDWWQRDTRIWRESPVFNHAVQRDAIIDITPGKIGARWRKVAAIDRFAMRHHAKFIRKQVASPKQRVIALLFDPQFYPYIEFLQPCDLAFHAYDAYPRQPHWDDQLCEYLSSLIDHAYLVTAASAPIAKAVGAERAIILENGADLDAFSAGPFLEEPIDLRDIPHPRICYAGSLNNKVDFPLIAEIAKRRPAWQWVLIGRVERDAILREDANGAAFVNCEELSNVHFLGQKHRTEMPAYVGHMDVNTMCYRASSSGWWSAGSPLKLHEYMAAGIPVVSAGLESLAHYSDVIVVADGVTDWLQKLEDSISNSSAGDAAARIAVAAANSWDQRVRVYENLLQQHRPDGLQ